MKIKDLLKLTETTPLEIIARDSLTIGKAKARQALKEAGCFYVNGLKGWGFDGPPENLEKEIYDFVPNTKIRPRPEIKPEIQQKTNLVNPINKKTKPINNKIENPTSKKGSEKAMKKVTYEIEEQLHDQLRIRAILEKRNVSEIANEIIKKALEK